MNAETKPKDSIVEVFQNLDARQMTDMTKDENDCELASVLTDEALLNWFAETYGQLVFCTEPHDKTELNKTEQILRAEILKRMKK